MHKLTKGINFSRFRIITFTVLLIASHLTQVSFAQSKDVFEEERGSLAEFFRPIEQSALEQYKKKYSQLHRKEGFEIKDLLTQGSAFTRGLHKTGIINFNSKATKYLNDIKSHLLSDYPKASQQIRVYITYNPALNAMATINEKIYVNVGLLARVKNEAQLAFIMAHELMHIINMHSVEQYKAIKKEVKNVQQSNVSRKADQIELFKHTMSVKHELEADADGFHLFLSAGYNPNEAYEALRILESADEELIQKQVSHEILRVREGVYDSLLLSIKNNDLKDVESKKTTIITVKDSDSEEVEELSTHPEVKQRLEKINELIKEFGKNPPTATYKISQALFEEIKLASLKIVNSSYNQSSDFGGAFLIYSNLLLEGQRSEDILHHYCYAIFGIIHDRKFKFNYNFNAYMSHEDSVFVTFYRKNDLNALSLWGLNALNAVRTEQNRATVDKYASKIIQLIKGDERIQRDDFNEFRLFDEVKSFEYTGLKFSEIDFKFSFFNSIPRSLKREFNQQKIHASKKEGKIAFVDMNNIAVDIGLTSAGLNYKRSDKLDLVSQNALLDLVSTYKKDLVLLIPNSVRYNDEQYNNFQLLSKWLTERIYFDAAPYESLYAKEMEAFKRDYDVRYLMVNLTLDVRNRGLLNFGRLVGIYLSPLYIPQAIANRQNGRTREYILTIMIDIETGDLVMWDKRTTEEPMNKAFIYNIYDDVLKSFMKKS